MISNAHRVRETSTTTGTGNVTLLGAVLKFRAFSSVIATNDDSFSYMIAQQSTPAEWEAGIGHLSSGTTLVRDQVLASSNGGSLVNFSAGTKDVFIFHTQRLEGAGYLSLFGDGSDGSSSPSSGTNLLTNDAYFEDYTPSGTSILDVNGGTNGNYWVHVSGTLDLTGTTQAGAIRADGRGSSSGFEGHNGGAGGGGGATGSGSAGGKGGAANGTGGAGSGDGSDGADVVHRKVRKFPSSLLWRDGTRILGGAAGGDAGVANGGNGGGVLFIAARRIRRGAGTALAAIRSLGSSGSTGAGGGGGGWVIILYEQLLGTAKAGAVSATGGFGGVGNPGAGSSGSGGGGGGAGGRITLVNVHTGEVTEVGPVAGSDGGTGTLGAGGTAGSPGSVTATL